MQNCNKATITSVAALQLVQGSSMKKRARKENCESGIGAGAYICGTENSEPLLKMVRYGI
jgi:hypothetical protein